MLLIISDLQSEEYLEEEYLENAQQYETYLPSIKTAVAYQSDVELDEGTKYRFTKKAGKVIEVRCTTSNGNVVFVEMEEVANRTFANAEPSNNAILFCFSRLRKFHK